MTDSGSEGSASEDEQLVEEDDDDELVMTAFDPSQETYADRFYALKDMISPSTRATLSTLSSSAGTWGKYGVNLAGNGAWVVITSAILLGLPLALAVEGETMFVQQEKMEREQLQGQQVSLSLGFALSSVYCVVM